MRRTKKMIRFIDLTGQITDEFEFALYDTITDKFVEYSGNQTWSSVDDFISDCTDTDIDRFVKLINASIPKFT
jgi:hypothetical protein